MPGTGPKSNAGSIRGVVLMPADTRTPLAPLRVYAYSGTDLLDWLSEPGKRHRFYWSGRQGEEIAACGSLLPPAGPGEAMEWIDRGDLFVVGALSFDPGSPSWREFPSQGLRIPSRIIHRSQGGTHLHLQDPDDTLGQPQEYTRESTPLPSAASRIDEPDERGWSRGVADILALIASGTVQKIVPARRTRLSLTGEADPLELFRALKAATPGCFHFALEGDQGWWMGASPEMLYERDGNRIRTEAVAGTCRRGDDRDEDEALGKALQDDPKEKKEHAAVVSMIQGVLGRLSDREVNPGQRHLLKLSRVQHLMTGFEAELRPGISDADILSLLHPTPATCGLPPDRALEWIRSHESFPRGYYAGPVGWMTRGKSCFSVGLRSALVRGSSIDLFAGAGIVGGSDPGREWAELDSKIGDWISLLVR